MSGRGRVVLDYCVRCDMPIITPGVHPHWHDSCAARWGLVIDDSAQPPRKPKPKKKRSKVLNVPVNAACYFCGRSFHGLTATREHLVPRALGGGNGKNVVLACHVCNAAKGARTEEEFASWVTAIYEHYIAPRMEEESA